MNSTILAAGVLPSTSFTIGGASQQLSYTIGVNPVTVPQDSQHVLSVILQIISPSGYVIYQNPGWGGGSFASPDSLTGTYNLPALTGMTTPESGLYQINIQAKYVDSTSAPVTTLATVNYLSAKICVSCLPVPVLTPVLDCTNVLLTITDTTQYTLQGYATTEVSRTITALPPAGSNQPTATGTAKVLQIDNGSEGNGALWNGTYTLGLASTATYQLGSTTIIQTLSYSAPAPVSCLDPRCILWCALDGLNTMYIAQLTSDTQLAVTQTLPQLLAGTAELTLINQAIECGQPFNNYVSNFWTVTGLNSDCGCGCVGETATGPVMPIPSGSGSGSPGAPGAPGSVWRTGSGAPSNSLGLNGDLYLDIVTGNVYQKISGTYSLSCNISGPAGAVGQQGAPGSNGAALLWNPFVNYTNTGAGAGDIFVSTIPATAFATPSNGTLGGDQVVVAIEGYTTGSHLAIEGSIILSAGGVQFAFLNYPRAVFFKANIYLTYTTATNIRIDCVYSYYNSAGQQFGTSFIATTQNVSYTAGNTLALEVDFSALSAASDAVLVFSQAISNRVISTNPSGLVPIYTTGSGTATYQNNAIKNISINNFNVYVDGILLIPTTQYTFISSTGTITRVGGTFGSSQSLAIIPN